MEGECGMVFVLLEDEGLFSFVISTSGLAFRVLKRVGKQAFVDHCGFGVASLQNVILEHCPSSVSEGLSEQVFSLDRLHVPSVAR